MTWLPAVDGGRVFACVIRLDSVMPVGVATPILGITGNTLEDVLVKPVDEPRLVVALETVGL